MSRFSAPYLLGALLVLTPACRAISPQAKVELAKPVDCATAQQDLSLLKKEQASVAKMFVDGVTAVVPAGAVLSLITLQEKDKLEVAIGVYNHRLKRKIEEIQNVCGVK